jgi:hypothetical protein
MKNTFTVIAAIVLSAGVANAAEYCVDVPQDMIEQAQAFRFPRGTVEDYIYFSVRQQALKDLNEKGERADKQRSAERDRQRREQFGQGRPNRPVRPNVPRNR